MNNEYGVRFIELTDVLMTLDACDDALIFVATGDWRKGKEMCSFADACKAVLEHGRPEWASWAIQAVHEALCEIAAEKGNKEEALSLCRRLGEMIDPFFRGRPERAHAALKAYCNIEAFHAALTLVAQHYMRPTSETQMDLCIIRQAKEGDWWEVARKPGDYRGDNRAYTCSSSEWDASVKEERRKRAVRLRALADKRFEERITVLDTQAQKVLRRG
jgi:hypothetical protein